MKVLVTGASGLVGGELIPFLQAKGHEIHKLSRSKASTAYQIQWDAGTGFSDDEAAKLESFDAVIHLAGDSVASGSWTDEKKRSIRESRVLGTRTLVDAFRKVKNPPRIFASASAVGFYGNRADEIMTEESEKGVGFFPEVCEAWETEALRAREFGARVVLPRIGIVLSKDGGALEKMLTPFKFGVGGTIGTGEQWMSWIAIDDLVRILVYALENEDLSGPVNAAAPNPVKNEEFTKTLGKVLNRPTILPIPAFGVNLLFGEMGKTLLLEGVRVVPDKLIQMEFEFLYPDLENALRHVLKE